MLVPARAGRLATMRAAPRIAAQIAVVIVRLLNSMMMTVLRATWFVNEKGRRHPASQTTAFGSSGIAAGRLGATPFFAWLGFTVSPEARKPRAFLLKSLQARRSDSAPDPTLGRRRSYAAWAISERRGSSLFRRSPER